MKNKLLPLFFALTPMTDKPSSSDPELYLENGEKADFWDVCSWWRTTYPDDIFVTKPYYVVQIRELMDKLCTRIMEANIAEDRDAMLEEIERGG